ncbi:LPXTG cell wall anchor domain-containing protein [Levilactobacillus yiduensis]|uniref:LPXTG cell wall anchor domain-containing protein n=1 Tax=Levilactobacillus yiduensis TaxID=2953880 RepID=UPI000EF2DAD9|nr:LPXTG cell wall anchor domain-containing protein [Levilactobacillus yiduensis]AYM03906.1 LPXTG cell wall anchor domain-containing protein [Levilactobacillus brevis]
MRLRDIGLLVLSLLIVGWGIPTAARADDVQQSQYSVTLTKPKTSPSPVINGGGGALIDGEDGDTVNGNPVNGHTHSAGATSPTGANGGQGATVSPAHSKQSGQAALVATRSTTGRLPQTSETWFGLGTMTGVIMLLLVWIGILFKRRKQQN